MSNGILYRGLGHPYSPLRTSLIDKAPSSQRCLLHTELQLWWLLLVLCLCVIFLTVYRLRYFPNCFIALLIYLIIIPLVPLAIPYFFFISSANAFSLDLLSRIYAGSMPRLGSPVIYAISSIVMGTGLSSHISPLCVTANSFLTHVVAYWPLPKCGSFSMLGS
jgi:hypothetical protein